jgi:hypothetical protein
MKMSLVIEVGSLEELDRVAKRLIPLAPVTPSTPVAPPVASPVAEAPRVTFPIAQRIEDDTAHHNRVQAAVSATVEPTQAQLEESLKAYGTKHGFDKARTLLNEYTTGKVGSVPAGRRAELYARLVA